MPKTKVVAGALAGSITVILAWAAGMYGLLVPPEVASAVTVLLTFAVSYLVPEPQPQPPPHG